MSMNVNEVLALYDREQRRAIEYPGMTRQVLPGIVRFVRPRPGMSFVLYSDLDEATADATIDEQIAYFQANGLKLEWKVYGHDRPADLVARLVARGFVPEEPDDIMVLDVATAPAALLAEPAADVRRLTDPAQLADVVAVGEAVWSGDFSWMYERMGGHMAIPGYLSIYVAYVAARPAAVGWTYFYDGHFAGLWGGSTLAEYRRHGLYTALLAARVREARARGVPYLTIDAGEMSRPIVARHGFQTITTATSCEWQGAPTQG
jgi:GNAT superfamily N-acetyltransferase